jgi:hypothetical protein
LLGVRSENAKKKRIKERAIKKFFFSSFCFFLYFLVRALREKKKRNSSNWGKEGDSEWIYGLVSFFIHLKRI